MRTYRFIWRTSGPQDAPGAGSSPLGALAALQLLLLVHYPAQQAGRGNGVRAALAGLQVGQVVGGRVWGQGVG